MKVHISKGNIKLGKIPNISLTPVLSCGKEVPCTKDCYAKKELNRKEVKIAWSENLEIAKNNPSLFFLEIAKFLEKKKPDFFRFHVAGDFLDQNYLNKVMLLCSLFPKTKFLTFTKMHKLDYSQKSDNLTIVFSYWPHWGDTNNNFPKAFMQDGTETRAQGALECPGNCENCGLCWNLPKISKNVVFNKH